MNKFLNYGASTNSSAAFSNIDWFMTLKNVSGDEVVVLFIYAAPSIIKL